MPTIYELMRFKDKEELERVYTDIIRADTKQADAQAEIRDITKFNTLNENADLFSVMIRQHLRHGRPVTSLIHKVYKDQEGAEAAAKYDGEVRAYVASNQIKPDRYGYAHQRELRVFPKSYGDQFEALKKRRSFLLDDITSERVTVHDELNKIQGKVIWEGLAPSLDPMILLTDFVPHEAHYKNYYDALKLERMTADGFTDEFSGAVTDLFIGGIPNFGHDAVYHLAAKYISCEERQDADSHLTIVKKKISPADNNTLSLIDGSDLIRASRMLPLGSFFCHPQIYEKIARREDLAENVYDSYFRRRQELVGEKNIGAYEISPGEFSAGFYLAGSFSNLSRAAFFFRAAEGLEEKMKVKAMKEIANLEIAALGQIAHMVDLDLSKEDKTLVKDLYASMAEAAKRSKLRG